MQEELELVRPARLIHARSLRDGGGTFDQQGQPITAGHAVSIRILAVADAMTEQVLGVAIKKAAPGMAVGTWFDFENGRWEVSESLVMDTLRDAMQVANFLDERYVFDIGRGLCIPVG